MYNETLKTAQQAVQAFKIEIYNQNILLTEAVNKMYRFKAILSESFHSEYFIIKLIDINRKSDNSEETEEEKDIYLYEVIKMLEREIATHKEVVCDIKVYVPFDSDTINIRANHSLTV